MSVEGTLPKRNSGEPTPHDADLGIMHHPKLSHVLTGELARLYRAGFWLLPLGLKREPLVKFRTGQGGATKRHPLSLVIEKMAGAGSSNYAIRLEGILVVDIDTDTPEAREYVRQRFGESSVQVKSPRGAHHYFRFDGKPPAPVRLTNIAIDFKAGSQSLIAGPFAERADGGHYLPLQGRLDSVASLPTFYDRDLEVDETEVEVDVVNSCPKIRRGDRHRHLKKRGMQMIPVVQTEAELFQEMLLYRDWECEFPEEVPDSEVEALARWFWFKRCNNEIWSGRQSPMGMTRASFDQLINVKYGDQAWMLYSYVHSKHEHLGREFVIVPEAILAAGQLQALSSKDIRRAAQILVDQKLLWRREVRDGFKRKYLYRIAGGRRGERSVDYINTQYGNTELSVIKGGLA
ncbi:hypothetical protein NGR_c11250 [Sinorhizobium fredii NGR234]|uniref:DNA primase/polymerase bifunctional N-terminal domain-containing protein n=1 Tax=Sinorhizobium fredii (strain NBRC 101917 / NGR234) TaxID=394 RepID=C3MAD1_SINFN|nr:hypothetical protein NGR_c11250 [Sinorhizobium fredii NGR234]